MKEKILNSVYRLYAILFARPVFASLNKFMFHLSLNGMGVLNHQSEYLSGERSFLKNYLNTIKKPVVFDVGANIGNYSKKALEANSGATIYAFEPHPETYKKLKENVKSHNLKAQNYGVSNEKGELELFDYEDNDGSSHASLYKEVIEDIHHKPSVSHMVPVITLDDFIREHKIDSIDLLKIDTEGNELNVLHGLADTLRANKIRCIHFEFNEMNIASKVSFKNFWDMLKGFRFYRLLPGGRLLKIKRYTPVMTEIYAYQNILAIRQ